MADTKEIKIVAGMDSKIDSKTQNFLTKQLSQLASPQNLKKTNKELSDMAKTWKAIGLSHEKISKLTEKWMVKDVKTATDGFKKYAAEVEKYRKREEKWGSSKRQEQWAVRSMGGQAAWNTSSRFAQQSALDRAHAHAEQMRETYGRGREFLEGSGAAQFASSVQEQKMYDRQRSVMKWMQRGQMANAGISLATNLGQGFLGFEMQEMRNKSASIGSTNQAYNQLASGSLEGFQMVRNLLNNPGAASRLIGKAGTANIVGNVGGVAQGAVSTALGAGVTAGSGGLALAAGGQMMGSGISSGVQSASNLIAGGQLSAEAQAWAEQNALKTAMDKATFQRSLAYVHGTSSEYAQRERTGRGTYKDLAEMGKLGIRINEGKEEMMSRRDQMANFVGYDRASEQMGAATTAAGQGRIDMGVASRYFGAAGMGSSKGGNARELQDIIAKGFALGFKDNTVRTALVEYATAAKESGFRTGGMGNMAYYASEMAGRGATVAEQKSAIDAQGVLGGIMSGKTGGYDRARGFQIAGDVLKKMGRGTAVEQALLGGADYEDFLDPSSKRMKLVFGDDGAAAQKGMQEFGRTKMRDVISQDPRMRAIFEKHRKLNPNASEEDVFKSIKTDEGDYKEFTRKFGGFLAVSKGVDVNKAEQVARGTFALASGESVEAEEGKRGVGKTLQERIMGFIKGNPMGGEGTDIERAKLDASLKEVADIQTYSVELKKLAVVYKDVATAFSAGDGIASSVEKASKAILALKSSIDELEISASKKAGTGP